MVLGVREPVFPFKAYLQGVERNTPNWESLSDLVPETMGQVMQLKKQQQMKNLITQIVNDPSASPALKQFGPLLSAYPDLGEKVLPALIRSSMGGKGGAMMDFDPATGTWSMPALPSAPSAAPPTGPTPVIPSAPGGAPPPGPKGKTIRLDLSNPAGRAEAAILDRQQRGKLGEKKVQASLMFAEARKKQADLAVAREVSRTMNPLLAPSGTGEGKVAFTNIRSGRNIQTLYQGPVTWQQVSNALSDIAGAYHGGAPFAQEYMNQAFPNINQHIAQWRTFITGTPDRNVPDAIRKELLKMSQTLLDLDNAVLRQNAKSQSKILGGVASPQQIQQGMQATEGFIRSSSGGQSAPQQSGGWSYVGPAQ